jgi:hypothetical protein
MLYVAFGLFFLKISEVPPCLMIRSCVDEAFAHGIIGTLSIISASYTAVHGVAGGPPIPSRGEKRTEAALSLGGVTLPRPTGTARFPYPIRSAHPSTTDQPSRAPPN